MTDIHLCQPDGCKSCGACCGLYNYVDNSREALRRRLRYRSRLYAAVRRKEIDLAAYREALRRREDGRRIYKTIYACEFLGFIDAAESRVGCLLHPMGNAGEDLRSAGFYGREVCEGHFCPSYQKLAANEAKIAVGVMDDWYLYGCVITDIDFIKEYFRIVQDRLAEEIRPDKILGSPRLTNFIRDYFRFKIGWPYRDNSRPRFGKYFFVGEDYDIAQIDYDKIDAQKSPYDKILLSLASSFETRDELAAANEMIYGNMEGFISEYRKTN